MSQWYDEDETASSLHCVSRGLCIAVGFGSYALLEGLYALQLQGQKP